MSQYDPILGKENFPKFSLFAPRPIVEPGTAIVLYRDNGELLTLMQGQRLTAGDSAWGNYKGYYRVDIATHDFNFQTKVPCNQDAFSFQAEVQVTYQVEKPAEIVQKQIRNIQNVLQPEIINQMRNISRKYNAKQCENAEQEINQIFLKGLRVNGLHVTRIVTNLELESVSRDHIRTIQDIENKIEQEKHVHEFDKIKSQHEFEIKNLKMEFYTPLIEKGEWKMLALHLAEHPEDVSTITQTIIQQRQSELENQLKMLKIMLEEDVIEGVQVEEVGKRVLQRLVDSLGPLETKALGIGDDQKKLPIEKSSKKRKANKTTPQEPSEDGDDD